MIWLSNSTLSRLRDQLRARGQRASMVPGGVAAFGSHPSFQGPDAVLAAEYGPLCEAMYLMMSADGSVSTEERDVLRGALRNLSEDSLRSAQVDALLDEARAAVAKEGRERRLGQVAQELQGDPARAEVAFVLAAAIAFADGAIADEENDTLSALAEGLGIDEARATALLDSVEADLQPPA